MNEHYNITSDTFVEWLRDALNNPTRPLPSIIDIQQQLDRVETGDTYWTEGLRQGEKLRAYIMGGFTRAEAFALVNNERMLFISYALNDKE